MPAVTIKQQVTVVGGGPAVPGARLDTCVHVTNTSANPRKPGGEHGKPERSGAGALTYVDGLRHERIANGVSVAGNVITTNYSDSDRLAEGRETCASAPR